MLEHTYRIVTLRGRNRVKRRVVVDFEDPNYSLLATFLNTEVKNFRNEICKEIEEVKEGEKMTGSFHGNHCHLVILGSTCVIFDDLADDGRGKWCRLPTNDFAELVEEWYIRSEALKNTPFNETV